MTFTQWSYAFPHLLQKKISKQHHTELNPGITINANTIIIIYYLERVTNDFDFFTWVDGRYDERYDIQHLTRKHWNLQHFV